MIIIKIFKDDDPSGTNIRLQVMAKTMIEGIMTRGWHIVRWRTMLRRVTVMYYVGDADRDNDTNCRSRSRSQHTATLG